MDPVVLRAAFRIAFLVFALAVVILPFQDRSSPEFVVTVLAALVGAIFLGLVWLMIRVASPPIPRDKPSANRYNTKVQDRGRDEP